MARFLIDEDLHRTLEETLIQLGHQASDVRDEGLRGASDNQVFQFAQEHNAVVITADLDFSNTVRFPIDSHHGIVILRFANELSTAAINAEVTKLLKDITDDELDGNLIVVSPGQVRMKRR